MGATFGVPPNAERVTLPPNATPEFIFGAKQALVDLRLQEAKHGDVVVEPTLDTTYQGGYIAVLAAVLQFRPATAV